MGSLFQKAKAALRPSPVPTISEPIFVRPPDRLPPYTPDLSALVAGAPALPPAPRPRPGTIPTRFLLLSDTHNQTLFPPNDIRHAFKAPLPRADVLLHAGDLSNSGALRQLQITYELLRAAPAELKLVIAGNHDLTLDAPYYRSVQVRRGRAATPADVEPELTACRELWTSPEAHAAGIRFLDEGIHCFELANGATFTIHASPYSPAFGDWAFMYPRSVDRYNPQSPAAADGAGAADGADEALDPQRPIADFPAVDILMTHGPPAQLMDRVRLGDHVGCEHLARAVARVRPRLHVFGHIHEDWGAMRVDWTAGTARLVAAGAVHDEETGEEVVKRGWVGWDGTGGRGKGAVRKGRPKAEEVGAEEEIENEAENKMVKEVELRWGEETLFVNAAIMDARFRPRNAPWVIDLLLPARDDGAHE